MTLTAKNPEASKWANKALDLFFPTVCAGCGKLGPMICENCLSQFSWVADPICHRCGSILIHPANVCGNCLSSDFNLQQVRASLIYREPVTSVIHKMKYHGFFALAKPLSELMIRTWPIWDDRPDLIIPVPLHRQRKKKRGFNQSALLAANLSELLNINIDFTSLKRVKNTKPQVGLSPEKRLENVRDAFIADRDIADGKRILLIDDVFTTGATMIAAAKELLSAGAASVSAYCLARAV